MTAASVSENLFDVAVIGSGPAGLAAALAASSSGHRVAVFERMPKTSLKLLASGGGRCNISNILSKDAFMAKFGREGRFMNDVLSKVYHDEIFAFLASKNIPVKADDGFHYFPVSGSAKDVAEAFRSAASKNDARFFTGETVTSLIFTPSAEGKHVAGGKTSSGRRFSANRIILACGGTAWESLGGTSDGLKLAEQAGHSIVPPLPAMAPLIVSDKWVGSLAGVSLKNASLSFGGGRTRFCNSGELLFTHSGFSGPCALDLAGDLAAYCADSPSHTAELVFAPCSGMTSCDWKTKFDEWRRISPKKNIRNLLSTVFPRSLADVMCGLADAADVPAGGLTAKTRDSLAELLSGVRLTATGSGPMHCAMAMKGGVRLREINPRTLESRIVKGLFFAGEIMDLVGPCGGYNIQWALSSGTVAGKSIGVE